MIDMASVYADRFKDNSDALRAAVMGQSPDPKLDPYTALNALKLIKESQRMAMAGQAQQPTSSPSILAENIAPSAPPQGLAGMVPMGAPTGQMPQGMPPQGMPPQGMPPQGMPQQTMQAASGGLANMYTPEEDYAEGGIVAFNGANGSVVPAYAGSSDGAVAFAGSSGNAAMDDPLDRLLAEAGVVEPATTDDGSQGNPAMREEAFQNYLESRGIIKGIKDDDFTPDEAKRMRQDTFEFYEKNAGPDIYAPANRRLTEREGARSKSKSQGEGLALLAAAGAILEGNTLARGASKAFPVFAKEMGEVQRADINEQRSIEQMQFALADAQRKERMGNIRGAQAAMETARKAKSDANRFKLNKAVALGTLDSKALQSLRPTGKAAGSGGDKALKLNEDLGAAEVAFEKDPSEANRQRVVALRRAVDRTKTTESGPGKLGAQNTQIFVGAAKDSSAEARKMLYTDPVMRSNDRAAISNRYRELYAESIQRRFPGTPLSDLLANMPAEELPAGGKAPAPAASAKALPMPASQDQLKVNQLYNTNRGLAIWNGTAFVPQ